MDNITIEKASKGDLSLKSAPSKLNYFGLFGAGVGASFAITLVSFLIVIFSGIAKYSWNVWAVLLVFGIPFIGLIISAVALYRKYSNKVGWFVLGYILVFAVFYAATFGSLGNF